MSRKPARLLSALVALGAAAAVAGCGGAGDSGGKLAKDGTLTMAIASDPGNLDPQGSPANVNLQLSRFAYDALVARNADGKIVPALAASWRAAGRGWVFTLGKGITCSDGTPLKASTVAANFNFVQDPRSHSPFFGGVIPPGLQAKADDAAGTVTLTPAEPFPFVLEAASSLPIVCAKGLADRRALERSSDGTGPYVLRDVRAGDSYTYVRRAGYTWGPEGATTAQAGMPARLVVKVIPNEATSANLLVGGQVNVATVSGPDRKRLDAASLFSRQNVTPQGEMFYNHAAGRPFSDERVRQALTAGADLSKVGQVLSGGVGVAPTGLVAITPKICPGNTVAGNVPAHDEATAKQLLDAAGWKAGADGARTKDGQRLSVSLLYDPALTANASAAAELLAQQWKALGADVKLNAQPVSRIQALTATGDFDAVWLPISASYPTMVMPFLTGPAPMEGLNFSHIQNADYDQATQAAMTKAGSAGCADWNRAEEAVFRAADIVPFVDNPVPTWGKNATFELVAGAIMPTSFRLSTP